MMVMIITTMFVLDIGFLETKFAPNAGRKKQLQDKRSLEFQPSYWKEDNGQAKQLLTHSQAVFESPPTGFFRCHCCI